MFEIQVPKMDDKAYKIDQKKGTNFSTKTIEKWITNARVYCKDLKGVASEHMRGEKKVKSGFKYVETHMIFDIKMDGNFPHKAIVVAGGHKTAPPIYHHLI